MSETASTSDAYLVRKAQAGEMTAAGQRDNLKRVTFEADRVSIAEAGGISLETHAGLLINA